MAEHVFMTAVTLSIDQDKEIAMRWDEGGVVHEVMGFYDDDYPEMRLRCGRTPSDVPTIGEPAELPAVSCLLCLQAELDEEEGVAW